MAAVSASVELAAGCCRPRRSEPRAGAIALRRPLVSDPVRCDVAGPEVGRAVRSVIGLVPSERLRPEVPLPGLITLCRHQMPLDDVGRLTHREVGQRPVPIPLPTRTKCAP
jgi:hypothetical protein